MTKIPPGHDLEDEYVEFVNSCLDVDCPEYYSVCCGATRFGAVERMDTCICGKEFVGGKCTARAIENMYEWYRKEVEAFSKPSLQDLRNARFLYLWLFVDLFLLMCAVMLVIDAF